MKQSIGYFNDGTATNPSDPNTMFNQGEVRNSVFNIPIRGVPDVQRFKKSKAYHVNDPDVVNQTFYSYGAQHTNIREKLN